jgi:hypothetical protein
VDEVTLGERAALGEWGPEDLVEAGEADLVPVEDKLCAVGGGVERLEGSRYFVRSFVWRFV